MRSVLGLVIIRKGRVCDTVVSACIFHLCKIKECCQIIISLESCEGKEIGSVFRGPNPNVLTLGCHFLAFLNSRNIPRIRTSKHGNHLVIVL